LTKIRYSLIIINQRTRITLKKCYLYFYYKEEIMKFIAKEIDFKSMVIGFLLAAVVFLSIGAYSSSGTQDVRIVGISTYDKLPVKIADVDSYKEIPVKITEVRTDVPVKITGVNYNTEIGVKILNQPIEVKNR